MLFSNSINYEPLSLYDGYNEERLNFAFIDYDKDLHLDEFDDKVSILKPAEEGFSAEISTALSFNL